MDKNNKIESKNCLKLLCDTDTLFVRLREKKLKNLTYHLAFCELIKFLKSDSGIVKDTDLAIIWISFGIATRYRMLSTFVNLGLIDITNSDEQHEDKRYRYIIIKIEWQDTLYEVWC